MGLLFLLLAVMKHHLGMFSMLTPLGGDQKSYYRVEKTL